MVSLAVLVVVPVATIHMAYTTVVLPRKEALAVLLDTGTLVVVDLVVINIGLVVVAAVLGKQGLLEPIIRQDKAEPVLVCLVLIMLVVAAVPVFITTPIRSFHLAAELAAAEMGL
jgi:hypothetical protein